MSEKLLEQILAESLPKDVDFNRWLLKRFRDEPSHSLEDFAAYFMGIVKSQTDEFVRNNTSTCNTPRKMTLSNIYDTPERDIPLSSEKKDNSTSRGTTNRLVPRHQTSARELFNKKEPESPQVFSRKSFDASTPVQNHKNKSIDMPHENSRGNRSMKNSFSMNDQSSLTFKNNSRNSSFDTSSRNNSATLNRRNSPMCLGDFLNTPPSSSKHGKKKNSSHSQSLDQTPIFSNSDFPTLGGESPIEPMKVQPKKVENKPKKRVVPITVSRKSTTGPSNFSSSSFQGENNLLNLPSEDGVDALCERKILRDQRDAITKDFTSEMEPQRNLHAVIRENLPAIAQSPKSSRKLAPFDFDDSKVEQKEILSLMAKVYSFILDMNLVANILSELSYLFNVLNTEYEHIGQTPSQDNNNSPVLLASNLLKNLQNCVFFIVQVINCQKQNLELLDVVTLRVVIDNERIQQLAVDLCNHLKLRIQQKSQLVTNVQASSGSNSNKVVLYQQETDNRDNFPSSQEFGAFKKQRDLFYSILRTWEFKHLDQTYDFQRDLGSKIRTLIITMEHPINMAHLARLFTAQLILSCIYDNSTSELQMDLPNVDLSKLSKLRQRLVAPSQFSTQYLFPGNQAFFRDFIICCDQHVVFMEQLKISLIYELMQLNDSSMDALCITSEDNKTENFREEFTVRAETMTTLRVLAKFVGFVISRPYAFETSYRNTLVDQKQAQIRNSVSSLCPQHSSFAHKTLLSLTFSSSSTASPRFRCQTGRSACDRWAKVACDDSMAR